MKKGYLSGDNLNIEAIDTAFGGCKAAKVPLPFGILMFLWFT